jgi:hypothetical protein
LVVPLRGAASSVLFHRVVSHVRSPTPSRYIKKPPRFLATAELVLAA